MSLPKTLGHLFVVGFLTLAVAGTVLAHEDLVSLQVRVAAKIARGLAAAPAMKLRLPIREHANLPEQWAISNTLLKHNLY